MACSDVGGRVTDGADSPAAARSSDRAKAIALQLLPGWRRLRLKTWVALATNFEWAGVVSGRAMRGGERRNTAASGNRIRAVRLESGIWNGHWVRCGRGGLVFLALARSAARRRLGGSAARRLVGSPAQWERPRNRSHVAARDRTTKPSWESDAQVELRRVPAFLSMEVSLKKVITHYEKNVPCPGVCLWRRTRAWHSRLCPPPRAPCWPAGLFSVLAGACQVSKAWARLRLIHHHAVPRHPRQ